MEANNSDTEPTEEAFVFHGGDQEVPKNVTRVIVDASVETIRVCAFAEQEHLKLVEICLGVKAIGERAFFGCSALEQIEIPSSVETIGMAAFFSCKSLKSIEIPLGIKAIGNGAFFECSSVQSVELPSSIKTIGMSAFINCKSLKWIKIPLGVKAIGFEAFSNCSAVESIEIPSSVETIGDSAFINCKSLKWIKIPLGVKAIGIEAFSNCSAVESIEIPSSVETIGNGAFQDCKSLKSIVMPLGVKAIGNGAFINCSSMESIELPSSIETIGGGAFRGCKSLKSIKIPATVKCVGASAFANCACLEAVEISGKIESMEIPDETDTTSDIVILDCALIKEKAVDYRWVSKSWIHHFLVRSPLHRLCCKAGATNDDILSLIESNPDLAGEKDAFGRTALHILVTNPDVELEVIQAVIDKYPEALTERGPKGMTPLHVACNNQCVNMSVIKALSHSYQGNENPPFMVVDEANDLPRMIAIKKGLSYDICFYLFSQYPIFDEANYCFRHYSTLITSPERHEQIQKFDRCQRHGWVHFISNVVPVCKVVDLIREHMEPKTVKTLALFKDLQGRSAIDSAPRDIRKAMQDIIFFLGRYDLSRGPPLHKSATSILIKAIDMKAEDEYRMQFKSFLGAGHESIGKYEIRKILEKLGIGTDEKLFEQRFTEIWDLNQDGQISEHEFVEMCKMEIDQGRPREVVLKFMRHKEHYEREVQSREKLKALYVVGISHAYTKNSVEDFHDQLASVGDIIPDIHDFEYIIVMPFADRNLDTIFRSERPDAIKKRAFATDLAYAIQHVHDAGLIHGDLKLLNVVRFNGRLRLIDLDAAVKKGSPIGAKFSSGVLPPEMIAELDIEEYKKFMSYFKHIKDDEKENEYWQKLHKNFPYFVKTFYTKSVSKDSYVGGDVVTKKFDEAQTNGLSYNIVEADASIDIWSFGVILFSLYTGETLFDVNRDDDMKNEQAMQELKNWDNKKKSLKLKHEKLQDPLVNALLSKMLSPSPSDRYKSMDEVLLDNYFKVHTTAEYIESFREGIRSDVRILLQDTREAILRRLRTSTTVICKAVFEAKEVSTPTCFVILKEKLPPPPPDSDSNSGKERVTKISEMLHYMLDVLEKAKGCVSAPIDFAAEYVKSQFVEESMWLYLIDEYTGEPVHSDEVYPLEISVRSEKAKKFLPVMALGMQSLALANGTVGLVNMFYPACPAKLVPDEFMEKVNAFIEESNRCGIIQRVVDGEQPNKVTVRGLDLRELEAFILKVDTARTFCGLQMVCDADSGKAMWVTKESAELMEIENRSDLTDPSQQVMQLKEEMKELQQSKEDAETAKEKVEDDLALKVQAIAGLEQSVKDAETAKQEVEEELRDLKLSNTRLAAELQIARTNASCCVTM